MPMYEVEHTCVLTPSQKDDIAEAITKIHSEQFGAPRIFVNVRFRSEEYVYVAGKRVGFFSLLFFSSSQHRWHISRLMAFPE